MDYSHYSIPRVVDKKYHESFANEEGRRAAHSYMPRISIRYCAAIMPCSSTPAPWASPRRPLIKRWGPRDTSPQAT